MIEHELIEEDLILGQEDTIDRALILAKRIATMAVQTRQQMVEFTGSIRNPPHNPNLPLADQERKLRIGSGSSDWTTITISENPFGRKTSYILDGVQNVVLILTRMVNHLMLRCCRNVIVRLDQGTTSGVDVLFSQGVGIEVPQHNWMNVEGTSTALIIGDLGSNAKIRVMSSLDIKVNGVDLQTNPFATICLEAENGTSGVEPGRNDRLSTMTLIV